MSTAVVPKSLPQPVLTFLKWQEATTGRDKVLRFVAYFSKYVIQVMKDNQFDKDYIERLTKGASAIGTSRKLIRFFRSVEYVNEFLKSFHVKDDVERYIGMFKAFSLGVWMVADHLQWLNKAGYLKLDNIKKIDEVHSKAWFWGLLSGIILCAYKLKLALDGIKVARAQLRAATASDSSNAAGSLVEANKKLVELDAAKSKNIMGLVKNGVDIMIPSARLGWLPISDGTVGLAGTVTSIIGIMDTWPGAPAKK